MLDIIPQSSKQNHNDPGLVSYQFKWLNKG